MAQVLSQDEVDALLNAVNDGDSDDFLGSDGGDFDDDDSDDNIQPYDLTNQDRVIRGRMPILEIIYERFIRSFRVSLSNSLRKISTISMISTDLLKFGEFVNTLPIPSCMCIMRFNELRGPALLVFESKLAYAIIDSYFGGTDRPFTKIEGKEFTAIELSFMKKVMDMAISDLEEAWAPVHRIDAQFIRTEINPQFVGVVPPSDVIIATTLEVEFESASGTIMIVVPYSTIEPIKQKLSSSYQTDNDMADSIWTQAMNEHIKHAQATIVVKLGEASMTVGDLLTLEKGDIIPLNQEASGEVTAEVQGVDKMKCLIGTYKGNRAVQITHVDKTPKGSIQFKHED
ncbi:flagellar motor switch protein FliM [Bacteriovorax sp. Seq25_V]|uniref:flagellar motor switch protein FliM n=1 Tax=Bacteriovorax sp. Seq25_V TaxID=1201288 RepID=UPI00038A3C29|nr:flagellar motor switch protein FliM [Bacteriovorax sp. Seq25_V]EQC47100.1 flagellar motor switch protein FliM [Bacteriovorax sp. Seq25_V]